ncbi:MAG: CPBP family intramembrane metalloprotease [Myxococcales bacterium]|nr:CPBP family intramembrane metalloprotease [Myxococcales bacterium]
MSSLCGDEINPYNPHLPKMELPTQDRQHAMTRSGHVLALYTGLSVVALFISAGRGSVDLYQLDEAVSGASLLLGPAIGLGLGLVVVFLSRLSVENFLWAKHLHSEFRSILGELSGREILILALASSVGEELLFRGALMPWLGIWAQAALFGALHFGPGKRFLPWTITALAVGVGFGFLAHWTGNLGAPIVAHFTINFLNLHFIVRTDIAAI